MRQLTIPVVVFTFALSCLSMASTAEAAKGIKKGNQTGTHTVHGIVTSINPDKTGYGVFQIRTSYNHKKNFGNNGLNNNVANSGSHHKTFNVSNSTSFQHHSNLGNNATNPMSLQRGQHVAVRFTGQHADQIQIYNSNTYHRMSGRGYHNYYVRHRTMAYNPYAYHHHHHRRGVGF